MPDAAFAAFNGLRVTLPSGHVLEGKPLAFPTALRFLELLDRYERGEPATETMVPLLREFPAAIQVDPAELIELTLGEANDLVRAFFYQRRWGPSAPNPAKPPLPSPTPAPASG